ncbi:MAG: hypothetical protein K8I00_10820, partial [Candidatus Omnitrophica bacterium]|nr:hypothetical protein [Candidatus Omnitrophota bacterium]
MPDFQLLFGVPEAHIQNTCVLTPFLSADLLQAMQVEEIHHGSPFSTGQANHFTLIHTQFGAPFVGDAVLHLADSPCKNLILISACGAVQDTDLCVGAAVIAETSLNCESFSTLLTGQSHPDQSGHANEDLIAAIHPLNNQLPKVRSASFGSFYLEETYFDFLVEKRIEVMEMETCAFYQAARHILRRAVAILTVTDI